MLFVAVVGISFAVAFLRGGRLSDTDTMRLMWIPPAALLLQLANLGIASVQVKSVTTLISYVLVFVFIAANSSRQGLRVVLVGLLLNLTVIAANGGRIPVDVDALRYVGQDPDWVLSGQGPKHMPMGEGTRLSFLGDVIPVKPLKRVFSIGDIFVYAGAFITVQELMGRRLAFFGPGGDR